MSPIETFVHVPAIVGTPSPAGADAQRWLGQWADEAATQAFALRLANCPAITNATLALHGELGAGKTTLARHLLRALGVSGRIKSPTYAVVEPHSAQGGPHGPLEAWHFDFYRLNDPLEWEESGFRDLFASPGLKLVEWPERAQGLVGTVDADILLEPGQPLALATQASEEIAEAEEAQAPCPRQVTFLARTRTGEQLLAALMA